MRKTLSSILILITMTGVSAASVIGESINGVWSTQEGCEWRSKAKDPAATTPDKMFDFMYLTDRGVDGYEWGCNFVKSFDGDNGEKVQIASCSAEGDAWPQMMITSQDGKNGWNVSILNEKNEPEHVNFPVRCKD